MIKNYIKTALRNLWKHKTFTVLNIVGLSVAFAVAILLSMTAVFELSYDKFHQNTERIYQLYTTEQTPKGPEASITNPIPLAAALKDEVPGIEHITRYLDNDITVTYEDKEINFDIAYIDDDFFSVFSFPETQGNATKAIRNKSGLVITEKTAMTLFGDQNSLGETVFLSVNGKDQPFTVAAILKDLPRKSSIDFEMAVAFIHSPEYTERKDTWGDKNHDVYIKLQQGISAARFEKNSRTFSNLHYANNISTAQRDGAQPDENGQYLQLGLAPFRDKIFMKFVNGKAITKKTYPYLILAISLLILLIACVNFVNMNIGMSVKRLQEIGVRKTLGAAKKQLFAQFWCESISVFLFSLITGILISLALTDPFRRIFRSSATFSDLSSPLVLGIAILSFILVTFLAGGYPAYLLSRLGTLQTLKGKLNIQGKHRLRNTLMVVQFSIAILLIGGSLVLGSQLHYMKGKDLGFNKEQVISFPLNGKKNSYQVLSLLRDELAGKPGILQVSASDNNLGHGKDGSEYRSVLGFDYKDRGIKTHMLVVDYDYPETLDIPLVSGRSFSREYSGDSLAVVINEAMAAQLGEEDPLNVSFILDGSVRYQVIGVVKDYHFEKLQQEIAPISLFMNNNWDLYYAYVKVGPENIAGALDQVKEAWRKIEPNAEFLGSYLDENINRTLQKEKTMTTIITIGSIIAIVLSCIGIFAISLLTIAQRTKEIGIRKVVGASISSITLLLSRDFLKLVGVAFVIVTPLSWWLAKSWLQDYSYRIDLSPWFFIASGAITTLIAFATLSFRTIKAAVENPVKSLKVD